MAKPTPRRSLTAATFALAITSPLALADGPKDAVQRFDTHFSDILGTALDLTVYAPTKTDFDNAESAVMSEIVRLKKILSAYDAEGEVAKLNASPVNGPGIPASPELIEVLQKYDALFKKTRGAYSGHAGNILALWKKGEAANQLPTDADLKAAAEAGKVPAWEIDPVAKTVRRISDQQIDVNSLGKGYIIDKAVAKATAGQTKIKGLLLNLGGDLRTFGTPGGTANGAGNALWEIGVQDPAHPELNAKPLTTLFVPGNTSVSSSGAYQRFYTIGGKQYSHIIDARTGQPGKNTAATLIAADSATANALATVCCSMRFAEALEIVRGTPSAEAMVVTADGNVIRSDGFKEIADAAQAAERFAPKSPSNFPAGYKLAIDLNLPPMQRRPYVFAWVTDAKGRHVKTLAAFGNEQKWLKEMKEWWKLAANDKKLLAVTHATQSAGKYPLSWDGTDQKGSGVPLGKYNVWVEVGAEHGPYSVKFAAIEVGKTPATAKINKSAAFDDVALTYGPANAAGKSQ